MHRKLLLFLLIVTSLIFSDKAFAYKYKDITYNLHTELKGTYDDNIAYTKDNTKADYIFGFDLGVSAKYEGKRFAADLLARIVPELYCQNSGYNNIDEYVSLSGSYDFTRYDRLFVQNSFSHTYNPQDFTDQFGRIGGRFSYYRNDLSIMFEKDISPQIVASAGFRNQISLPSVSSVADSYYNEGNFSMSYYWSTKTILSAQYVIGVRSFKDGNSSLSNIFTGGLRQYFTEQLFFDGTAGISLMNSYDDSFYARPVFTAKLTDQISETTSINIAFVKEYYSIAYSEDLFNKWQISTGGNISPMKRLRFSWNIFYGNGQYVQQGIDDDLFGANVGLSYDITDKIVGYLGYNFSTVNSDLRTREYNKSTLTTSVRAIF